MSQDQETRKRKSRPDRRSTRSRTQTGRRDVVEVPNPTLGSRICLCFKKMNGQVLEPFMNRHLRPCIRRIPCIDSKLRKDEGLLRNQPKYKRPKTRRQLDLVSRNSASARHHKGSYLRLPPLDEEHESNEWNYRNWSKEDVNWNPVGSESRDSSSRPSTVEEVYIDPYTYMGRQGQYLSSLPIFNRNPPLKFSSGIVQGLTDFQKICRPHMSPKRSEGPREFPIPNLQRLSQAPIVPTLLEPEDRRWVNPKAMLPNIPFWEKELDELDEKIVKEKSKETSNEWTSGPGQTKEKARDGHGHLKKLKPGPVKRQKSSMTLLRESSYVLSKWGQVKSVFFPVNDHIPTREGCSFPKFQRDLDMNELELKHLKASIARNRILERKQSEARTKFQHWEQRRLIGLNKRSLRAEKNVPCVQVTGKLEKRFHHIHSFFHSNDKQNQGPNQVGRYFDMEDKNIVAIKIYGPIFAANVTDKLRSKLSALTEIHALLKMDHYNVVKMLAYFELDGRMHVILEACDHSLRSEIEKAPKGVDSKMAQDVIHQVLAGLAFCHSIRCLHTDISPENILVTSEGVVKLADFDKSIFLRNEGRRPFLTAGTIVYGAPELLDKKDDYGLPSDVWSVGCVLAELLRGSPLWNYPTAEEQLARITKSFMPTFPEYPETVKCSTLFQMGPVRTLREMVSTFSPSALSFVLDCLEIEPHRRGTCGELLSHPFLRTNLDGMENLTQWDWMTQAISTARSYSAPNTADEFDPDVVCADEYGSDSCVEIAVSAISPRESTDQPDSTFECLPEEEASSVGQPLNDEYNAGTKRGSPQEGKQNVRKIRLRKIPSVKESGRKPVVATSDLDTGRSTAYSLSNDEGFGADRSRKVQRPKCSVRRQSSWAPSSATDYGTDSFLPVPNIRKHEKRAMRASMTDLSALTASKMCATQQSSADVVPVTSKGILKNIMDSIPSVTWESCEEICSHLNRLSRTAPKMFTARINDLVTSLLQQIAVPKSKVAGPAIKILENLYKIAPKRLEVESERILEAVLLKVGGPAFIDNSACQIMTEMVFHVPAIRVCTHLAKFGPKLRMGIARAVSAKFLCDAVRRLDLDKDIGDSTPSKRRLTCTIFAAAIKYNQDSHLPTRDYARELFALLACHSEFWRLYAAIVPDQERARVDKVLAEIRRGHGGPSSNFKQ